MGCFRSKVNREPEKAKIYRATDLKVRPGAFVQERQECFEQVYTLDKILGQGAFASVYKCIEKSTGHIRAVKVVNKQGLCMEHFNLRQKLTEIQALKELDHPNILKIYEIYEDKRSFYIVMEYCSGGELFDVVIKRRHFTDREAQTIMFQLLSAVSYFHDRNIIHRDLKPENILLEDSKEFFIKIADFGNSVIYQNRKLKGCFGSVYYIAPEVLANNYNQKCDVWSCGVIMYILLTGRPPFNGRTDDEIFKNIKIGTYNIEGDNLPILTDDAKDLIKKLLEKNPERRVTAANALEHRWIKRMNREVQASALNHAITSLQEFSSTAKMKTAVGTFIASQLVTHKEIKELKKVFQALDKNGDGRLSKEELMEGYKSTLGTFDLEQKIIEVISKVDSDGNGFVDYTEFIQATLHNEILTSTKNLQAAFRAFDRDGSGRISASELRSLLSDGALSEDALWMDVIKEVDQNGDGEIDLKEFESLLITKLDMKM